MVFHNVLTDFPPNIEVRAEGLNGASLSQRQMYVRCNFAPPFQLSPGFQLVIPGRAPRLVTVDSFKNLADVDIDMVLECAGNGRAFMEPLPDGVAWGLGGVSPISIAGVRLADVIGSLPEDIVDLVLTGADGYQFAIGREEALSKAPILVTHLGGEALNTRHGGTIRLIVPGQYAMKSVKWLTKVEAVTNSFRGHFVEKYRYYGDTAGRKEFERVGAIAVRSIISSPVVGESVPAEGIDIRGSAWTGTGEVTEVEVSIDDEKTWHSADLIRREFGGRWAPIRWAITVEAEPGDIEITARATDSEGNTQPLESRWNRNGYANNVVHRLPVTVV
jgi:DMSO/TMAO reductase YedYZ molybdopterin-dependent catalytic subunit